MNNDDLEDMLQDGVLERLKEESESICKKLGLDSILITATKFNQKLNGGSTTRYNVNHGNCYSSMGAAMKWLVGEILDKDGD